MRRTGAVLVILNALIFIIGMISAFSSTSGGFGILLLLLLLFGLSQIFLGIKGFTTDSSMTYGIVSLIITIIELVIGGMMVFQLVLGVVGGILLIFPRK